MKKVKISEYDILTTLGVGIESILIIGTFGRVRLIKHKQNNNYYAAKILKKSDIIKSKQIDHVQSESEILSCLSHPFIVSLHTIFLGEIRRFYSRQPTPILYPGLHSRWITSNSSSECRTTGFRPGCVHNKIFSLYTAQVVLIFEYLHKQNIVYRDLKPENLLLA